MGRGESGAQTSRSLWGQRAGPLGCTEGAFLWGLSPELGGAGKQGKPLPGGPSEDQQHRLPWEPSDMQIPGPTRTCSRAAASEETQGLDAHRAPGARIPVTMDTVPPLLCPSPSSATGASVLSGPASETELDAG